MAAFGIICYVLLLIALSAVWRGYVLTVLWVWFVVPVFAAPELRVPYAIGLSAIVGFLTLKVKASDEEDTMTTEKFVKATGRVIFLPAFFLGFCWIVKQFI